MPSVIRGSDNFDTAGGNAVKAWVNFDGTGTVAIRAAFNVSSITDNGAGDYTLNFTAALTDANYASNISARNPSGLYVMAMEHGNSVVRTVTQLRILIGRYDNTANLDSASVSVSIFR